MIFGNPPMLWLMAVVVMLLGGFLYWAWRKRIRDMGQFVRSRLLASLTVGVNPARQKIRLIMIVVAVAGIMLALARPQWGFTLEELKQSGLDIVVAIDTSRSMLAQDVQPNRLERAKLAAFELMSLARRDRLGLVAFSGTAFLQCPLTVDDEAFRQSVMLLQPGIIPQGGTALAEAIRTALTAFKNDENNPKVIILITDGEDHEELVQELAQRAAKSEAHIFTIGVGTPEGELLPIKDAKGGGSYVKDEGGDVVKSRLNEELLKEIARTGNGFYLPLRGAKTMDTLYEQGLAPLLGEFSLSTLKSGDKKPVRVMRHYVERFQWPLGIAIILLIVELFVPVRQWVFRRRYKAKTVVTAGQTLATLVILLWIAPGVEASSASAMKLYKEGKYAEAMKEYQRLQKQKPEDVRLAFNAGVSAFQAHEYETAVSQFDAATTSRDLKLQQQAYYNLGNSFFRLGEKIGEPDKQVAAWEQAVQNYETALKYDPKDQDARHNLDWARKKLEELKRQQAEQQNQNNKQDQKDKKDQKDQKDQKKNESKDSKQDQKDQSQKDETKSDQQKKDSGEDKKQQSPQEKDKKPGSEDQQKGQDKKQPKPEKGETNDVAQAAQMGKMTPEQVRQLLDAQKYDEKAILFVPKDAKPRDRRFKDW